MVRPAGRVRGVRQSQLVRISTSIRIVDDPRAIRAAEVVTKPHPDLIYYSQDKRRERDRDAEVRYRHACERAARAPGLGLNYVPAAEAASTLAIEDVLRRFEILVQRQSADSPREMPAILGGAPAPIIFLLTRNCARAWRAAPRGSDLIAAIEPRASAQTIGCNASTPCLSWVHPLQWRQRLGAARTI